MSHIHYQSRFNLIAYVSCVYCVCLYRRTENTKNTAHIVVVVVGLPLPLINQIYISSYVCIKYIVYAMLSIHIYIWYLEKSFIKARKRRSVNIVNSWHILCTLILWIFCFAHSNILLKLKWLGIGFGYKGNKRNFIRAFGMNHHTMYILYSLCNGFLLLLFSFRIRNQQQ